jgi:DNA-directed RNA polymerase subunit RPC12/RpoP
MGKSKNPRKCPRCGSRDILLQDSFDGGFDLYVCSDCDHEFEVGEGLKKNHGRNYYSEDYSDFEHEEEEWERQSRSHSE